VRRLQVSNRMFHRSTSLSLKSLSASNLLKEFKSHPSAIISKSKFTQLCHSHNVQDSEKLLEDFISSGNVLTVQEWIIIKPEPIFEYVKQGMNPISEQELQKLEEIEAQIKKIDDRSRMHANLISSGGLAILLGQFGLYAYLTWEVLSWDIMEPITYFTGQFNLIASYVYFLMAKREHSLEKQYYSSFESKRDKLLRRHGIDLDEYSRLKNRAKNVL
jgi:hypothetical protein